MIVVDRTGQRFTRATEAARTLQGALDDWARAEPVLRTLSARLEDGTAVAERVDCEQLAAPLPRAYEWIDGSAYLNHVRLVRRARKAELPPDLETEPLVYQGGSGHLARTTPCARIPQRKNASTSDTTNAGSGDESPSDSRPARKVRQWACKVLYSSVSSGRWRS